jgi:hypothetical protein
MKLCAVVKASCAAPEEDSGCQICFLPRHVIDAVVKRSSDKNAAVQLGPFICRPFPTPYSAEDARNEAFFEPTVSRDVESLILRPRCRSECDVKPLSSVSAAVVNVTLLRKSKFKPEDCFGYEDAVKTFLVGLFVADKSYVRLDPGFEPFEYAFVKIDEPSTVKEDQALLVCSKTRVVLVGSVSVDRIACRSRLSQLTANLLKLDSFSSAEKELVDHINLVSRFTSQRSTPANPFSRGILVTGLPGVGKTKLVQTVCSKLDVFLVQPSMVELTDANPGETEKKLEAAFEEALVHCLEGRTAMVFDPVEAFCPASAKPRHRRLALKFLGLVEEYLEKEENLFVVGVTSQFRGGYDQGLVSPGRLMTEVS